MKLDELLLLQKHCDKTWIISACINVISWVVMGFDSYICQVSVRISTAMMVLYFSLLIIIYFKRKASKDWRDKNDIWDRQDD